MTEKRDGLPVRLTFLLVQEESFFLEPLQEAEQVSDVILPILAADDHSRAADHRAVGARFAGNTTPRYLDQMAFGGT